MKVIRSPKRTHCFFDVLKNGDTFYHPGSHTLCMRLDFEKFEFHYIFLEDGIEDWCNVGDPGMNTFEEIEIAYGIFVEDDEVFLKGEGK